jgi:hypothetical protein
MAADDGASTDDLMLDPRVFTTRLTIAAVPFTLTDGDCFHGG